MCVGGGGGGIGKFLKKTMRWHVSRLPGPLVDRLLRLHTCFCYLAGAKLCRDIAVCT